MNMTNIRKKIFGLATVIFLFATASCQMDDTLYYNNLTMGNVVEGRFVSDQGNTFNIVEQICGGQLFLMKLMCIFCDFKILFGNIIELSGNLQQHSHHSVAFTVK